MLSFHTLFESKNEWRKIEQVPIPIPRVSNFPYVKKRKTKSGDNPIYPFWGKIRQTRHTYLKEAQESTGKTV